MLTPVVAIGHIDVERVIVLFALGVLAAESFFGIHSGISHGFSLKIPARLVVPHIGFVVGIVIFIKIGIDHQSFDGSDLGKKFRSEAPFFF